MHAEVRREGVIERPGAVWAISILWAVTSVAYVGVAVLYFSGGEALSPSIRASLDGKTAAWWIGAAAIQVLSLASTWSLFTMRDATVRWWGATLVYAFVATVFNLATGGWLAVLETSTWLWAVAGDVLIGMIYAYAMQLRSRGLLNDSPPAQGKQTQPLLVAAVAVASLMTGMIQAVAHGVLILLSHFFARAIDSVWYSAAVVTLSTLLLISGVGIWQRWPASRHLNILSAAGLTAVLSANLLDGLAALILSAVCVTRRSVNAFFAGTRAALDATEVIGTPPSLLWFSWLLLVAYVAGMLAAPLWWN